MGLKVKLNLAGLDGNAFAILGAFQRAAKKQGYSTEEINDVMEEATSGDYLHLLKTMTDNTVAEHERT